MAALELGPRYTCWICGKEVLLEACNTDDCGRMVHEVCYSLRLAGEAKDALQALAPQNVSGEMRRSWKEIAMDVLGETDRGRFRALAEELYDALSEEQRTRARLPENNADLSSKTSQRMAFEQIVDDAVSVMRSDFSSLQMLFPERGTGGELRLLAFRGFNPEAAGFWEWVRADSKSTCGLALRDSERVVAADIATCDFMADSDDKQVYLQTGILSCQTTPLIGRAGNVVGMISTHWRTPHLPSECDFHRFDILAKQAAEVVELCKRYQEQ